MDPEVIDAPPAAAPAAATPPPPPAPPDRGDVVAGEAPPSAEALAAVVAAGPVDEPVIDPAADPATKGGKKQGSDHVPIGRFNEVNEAKKALERENAELKAKVAAPAAAPATPAPPAPPAFDEDAEEKAYVEAMLDGDTDKALKIRKTINAHIREQATASATQTVRGEMSAKEVGNDLQRASTQAVADFPYLDTEEGAEALELIVASRDRRIAQGVAPGEALRLAVAAIAPKFAPAAEAPAPDPANKDTRPAAALTRGAAASTAQPPAIQAGIGNRATASAVTPSQLTDEQFAALTPAEKKKLRGD